MSSISAFAGSNNTSFLGLQVLNQSGMIWKMKYAFNAPSGGSYSLSWLDHSQQAVPQDLPVRPGLSDDMILHYNGAMGSQVSDSGIITFYLASYPQKTCVYKFNLNPVSKNFTLSLDQSLSTELDCAAFVKTRKMYMEYQMSTNFSGYDN